MKNVGERNDEIKIGKINEFEIKQRKGEKKRMKFSDNDVK